MNPSPVLRRLHHVLEDLQDLEDALAAEFTEESGGAGPAPA